MPAQDIWLEVGGPVPREQRAGPLSPGDARGLGVSQKGLCLAHPTGGGQGQGSEPPDRGPYGESLSLSSPSGHPGEGVRSMGAPGQCTARETWEIHLPHPPSPRRLSPWQSSHAVGAGHVPGPSGVWGGVTETGRDRDRDRETAGDRDRDGDPAPYTTAPTTPDILHVVSDLRHPCSLGQKPQAVCFLLQGCVAHGGCLTTPHRMRQ